MAKMAIATSISTAENLPLGSVVSVIVVALVARSMVTLWVVKILKFAFCTATC